MMIEKVNLAQKFDLFDEYWSPRITGELKRFVCETGKTQGRICVASA